MVPTTVRWRALVSVLVVAVALAGCGGSDDDESSGGDDVDTTVAAPEDGGAETTEPLEEAEQAVGSPDCAQLETAVTALVGPGSRSQQGEVTCQFFGDGPDGTSGWRVNLSGNGPSYPDLDFESASRSGFGDPEGIVEEDAPEGWTVAASRTTQEPDPDFPTATSERWLYFGGRGVAGLLTCRIQLDSRGMPGEAPPEPPAIDTDAFLTFCNTAKEQAVADAE